MAVQRFLEVLFPRFVQDSILMLLLSSFLSKNFLSTKMVHTYSSMDTTTTMKKIILSDSYDFHTVSNLSIALNTFNRCLLTSLSVDERLLLRYLNLTTNLRVEMAPFCWKHMYPILFAFGYRPTLPAAGCNLCSRHSTWAYVFG